MQNEDQNTSQTWDLIIIGAGIYGIQVARTYLELLPTKRLVLLEAGKSLGGVWSRNRVYEDFWTQTPLRILEFSDKRMHEVTKEDQYYGFFKAGHVAKYLEDYCSGHTYNGSSLTSRIQLGTSVTKVYKVNSAWRVETGIDGEPGLQYSSPQLVDASGLTSKPNWPQLPGKEYFKGQIIHHEDFAKWEQNQKSGSGNRIIVLGGAKSAADVAYSRAKAGDHVTWLIRRSGSGPAAFVSAKGSLGYKNSNEAFYTRFTSLFLGSIFSFQNGYDRISDWIQSTLPGQKLLQRIWKSINSKAWREADYEREDGRGNGYRNLKPDTEIFWQNDSTGVNQRDDFFDVIARRVTVIREDMKSMSESGIALADGRTVEADTIICATGWKDAHPYFEPGAAAELGLPIDASDLDAETLAHWNQLDASAENDILKELPLLNSPWAPRPPEESSTETAPYRLWKLMVPLDDPSLVFVGKAMLGNHFRNAEVQALFACTVLSNIVKLPPLSEMELDVATTVAWCRKRYPAGKGRLGNWLYWDMIPYTDMLLAEMGLSSHRSKSWWRDLFRPCFAQDLGGLIGELKEKMAKQNT